MVSEVAWGDGTGGKIYLTYSASEGSQTVAVSSDANTGAARSKVVTFSASGVTPVTLTVSQAAGVTPSYPLPSGAIPCELIYSTGHSSFVDTNLVPSSYEISIETEIEWSRVNNTMEAALGYYISSPVERFNPVARSSSAGNFFIGMGNTEAVGNFPVANDRVLRCRMKVTANRNGGTVLTYDTDGNLIDTQNLSFSNTKTTLSGRSIGLLGRKTSASSIADGVFRGALGRTKIYGDDHFGTLIADYEGCYYNGNFGFWDHISGTHLIGNVPADIFGTGEHWNTEGWLPNTRNVNSTSYRDRLESYRGWNTSPLIAIPSGCTSIRFNAGTTGTRNYALFMYDSNKAYKAYYDYSSADRQVSVVSGAAYVRLSVDRAYQDSCYMYDVTNGQYIWKGVSI